MWIVALSVAASVVIPWRTDAVLQCPKVRWRQCEACQRRIQEEGLEDEFHLQSWFVGRINTFLKAQGRILIGWDEILEGGLSPGAVVMSWRVSPHNVFAYTATGKVAGSGAQGSNTSRRCLKAAKSVASFLRRPVVASSFPDVLDRLKAPARHADRSSSTDLRAMCQSLLSWTA